MAKIGEVVNVVVTFVIAVSAHVSPRDVAFCGKYCIEAGGLGGTCRSEGRTMLPGPSVMIRRRTCASGRTLRRATVRTGTVLAAPWLMPAHVDGKLHMIFPSCRVKRPGVTYSAFHLSSGLFPSVGSHPGF